MCVRERGAVYASDKATDGLQTVRQTHTEKQEYKTWWHIQLWWLRDIHKSPHFLIDSTSSAISSERLISPVRHVFVDRNQMVLRRLGYSIIMFMESRWHEIWGRYMEKLLRAVLGLPRTGPDSIEAAMKPCYDDILLPKFYALPVETGCWGRHAEREIKFYMSRSPFSQGQGSLQKFKRKKSGADFWVG